MTSFHKLVSRLCLMVFAASPIAWPQQKPGPDWTAFQFLQGKWVGEGSSEAGQGSGYASFKLDLNNQVWIRNNHAEHPAQDNHGKYVHEDLMVVYFDNTTGQTRASYWDTEGHIIFYTVTVSNDGNTLTFLGDRQEGASRFRLTYVRSAQDRMSIVLEMAQPGKLDHFQKIVEGKMRKVP